MPDTTYQTPGGTLRGYVATPEGAGPWPGVVVIHEAMGMTHDMRGAADKVAAGGYVAFLPDLYSYGPTPRCLLATMRTLMRGGGGRALQDIDAARDYLVGRDDCTGKVGIIGFCMGGGFAILAANRGFDVAAPNYGQVPRDAERALAGSCPVVGSYGARDWMYRGAAAKLSKALEANGVDHDVKEYPDAAHGFMVRHTGAWAPAERIPGMGYVEGSSEDAWERVFAYFARHLA
jgi:carboxymethylenebutenolidase